MIGSTTMTESARKRRNLSEAMDSVLSTTPTRKTRRQKDWLNELESEDSEVSRRQSPRRTPKRTPQRGRSPGSRSGKGSVVRSIGSYIDDDLQTDITPKSFYGGKQRRYLSPLERREARELEEQRLKRLSPKDESVKKTSPKKTPQQSKTPKSKITKPVSAKKNVSVRKKMVENPVKRLNNESVKTQVSPRKTADVPLRVSPRKSMLDVPRMSPRRSPRKTPKLNDTPHKKLFPSNGCEEEFTLRSSPRKSPRRSSPRKQVKQSYDSPKFESGLYFGDKSATKKTATKGIKMYMQALNKNKKNLPPLSGKKAKTPTAVPKKSTPASQRSPSLTPTRWTPKNTKETSETVVKKFSFADKPQVEAINEIKMVITENGDDPPSPHKVTKTYAKSTLSPDRNGASLSANRSPQKLSCDGVTDNRSPQKLSCDGVTANRNPQMLSCDGVTANGNVKKRSLSDSPMKSPKKKKMADFDRNQGSPKSDDGEKQKGIKMFPIFTNPSQPSPQSKVKKVGVLSNSPRSRLSHSPKLRRSPILKKSRDKDGKEQMMLDLGQKGFGATMCSTCGMVYSMAEPEDESDHLKFHTKYLECVKFPGWKKEHVIHEYHDGRIIMVTADDPKYAQKKVEDVRELVDSELGFLEGGIACKQNSKAFLFISNEKKVVGCCIAEKISKGYRVIADEDQDNSLDIVEERKRAWCCSNDPVHAVCGISRIWVSGHTRRKKIATRLIDCLRSNFTYGCSLSNDEMAFSDPTPDGKIFATKYTGTPRFLVYNFTSN